MDFNDTSEEAAFRAEARAFRLPMRNVRAGRDLCFGWAISARMRCSAAKNGRQRSAMPALPALPGRGLSVAERQIADLQVIYQQEEDNYAVPRVVCSRSVSDVHPNDDGLCAT